MKIRRAILFVVVIVVVALARLTVPVEANPQAYPHIHYTGEVAQADGSQIPGTTDAVDVFPSGLDYSRLAPQGCYAGGSPGSSLGAPRRFDIMVIIRDTPECVQAMQTFQPDPSVFPLPVKPGWTFRRR